MTKKIRKQKGTFGNSTHENRNKETQLKDWKISYEMAENEQKGKEIELTINVGENQIIFNGNNITTSKNINAEISYNLASDDVLLKEIVQDGVVINFANNGELPGIATIRIKVTDEIKNALNMKTILVYH